MAAINHQLFKIPIQSEKDFDIDKLSLDKINNFLNDSNIVYVNHSISIIYESIREYNDFKNIPKYLIVSLIFKNLKETPLDLTKASKKSVAAVKKSIEQDDKIDPPSYKTEFEKRLNK